MHAGLPKATLKNRSGCFPFLPYAGINRIRFNGSTLMFKSVSGEIATPRK